MPVGYGGNWRGGGRSRVKLRLGYSMLSAHTHIHLAWLVLVSLQVVFSNLDCSIIWYTLPHHPTTHFFCWLFLFFSFFFIALVTFLSYDICTCNFSDIIPLPLLFSLIPPAFKSYCIPLGYTFVTRFLKQASREPEHWLFVQYIDTFRVTTNHNNWYLLIQLISRHDWLVLEPGSLSALAPI